MKFQKHVWSSTFNQAKSALSLLQKSLLFDFSFNKYVKVTLTNKIYRNNLSTIPKKTEQVFLLYKDLNSRSHLFFLHGCSVAVHPEPKSLGGQVFVSKAMIAEHAKNKKQKTDS
jgi:hypothetical protein